VSNSVNRDDVTARLAAISGEGYVGSSRRQLAELGIALEPGDAPAWWVRAGSAAEVSELIRLASETRVCVIPLGNVARAPRVGELRNRPCLFIDSRRMNHVLHLDETSLVAHVQAGVTAQELERVLAPRGLSIGDYPPGALNATMGGLVSVRTPGKSSPRHGFFEDAVLGVSAVLADGRAIHTRVAPRRASGPDLGRALCGSEGTIGFVTSVVLRIHRRPESRLLDAHALPSVSAALSAVHLALREDARPAGMRVYDAEEALAHFGDAICDPDQAVLVVATAGPTDLAVVDRDLVASAATAMGGSGLGADPADQWWRQRTGTNEPSAAPAPTLQMAATPSQQLPIYEAVRDAANLAGARARAHISRFDADGAVLFFTLTDDLGQPLAGDALESAIDAATEAAAKAGAALLGHSQKEVDPYLAAMRERLDPHGIMNPAALIDT